MSDSVGMGIDELDDGFRATITYEGDVVWSQRFLGFAATVVEMAASAKGVSRMEVIAEAWCREADIDYSECEFTGGDSSE